MLCLLTLLRLYTVLVVVQCFRRDALSPGISLQPVLLRQLQLTQWGTTPKIGASLGGYKPMVLWAHISSQFKRYLGWFCHFRSVHCRVQQTNTDIHTDHATSVATGRIFALGACDAA